VIGLGTLINIVAILVGSAIGVALGHRLPQRTRDVVTDGLGLITLLVAALSAAAVLDPAVEPAVGAAGVLIVLGSVLIGGIIGSLLQIEARLEGVGESIRRRLGDGRTDVEVDGSLADPDPSAAPRSTFVEGFVTASLVFCVGPLAILGSLSDGLGLGIDQLALKSILDGFASIAFAATLGWGVAASALVVGVYQGGLTLAGWALGSVLSQAQVALITATGGLLLVGIALRLLRIRQVPVGDLLPALAIAPILTAVVAALR
jgi:uncharacterized membrane protein YqgA involved in biofilm formation